MAEGAEGANDYMSIDATGHYHCMLVYVHPLLAAGTEAEANHSLRSVHVAAGNMQ